MLLVVDKGWLQTSAIQGEIEKKAQEIPVKDGNIPAKKRVSKKPPESAVEAGDGRGNSQLEPKRPKKRKADSPTNPAKEVGHIKFSFLSPVMVLLNAF